MSQDGQGFSFTVLSLQFVVESLAVRVTPQEKNRGFREGPFEVGVADLLAGGSQALSSGFLGAFDKPAVGDEILDTREAFDVVNLVENDECQNFPDTRNRAESMECLRVVLFCGTDNIEFQVGEQGVVVPEHFEIDFDSLFDAGVRKPIGDACPVGLVGDLLSDFREVVLTVGVLYVNKQFGSLVHEVHPAAQKVTSGAHFGRIHICHRVHAASQQSGNLVSVDLVIFGLSAVDGFHIERVAQDEEDFFSSAEIREPIPGEHAFNRDYDILPVRSNELQESIGIRRQVAMYENVAFAVQDADIHRSCVKVNSAVILVLLSVESHKVSSYWVMV